MGRKKIADGGRGHCATVGSIKLSGTSPTLGFGECTNPVGQDRGKLARCEYAFTDRPEEGCSGPQLVTWIVEARIEKADGQSEFPPHHLDWLNEIRIVRNEYPDLIAVLEAIDQ